MLPTKFVDVRAIGVQGYEIPLTKVLSVVRQLVNLLKQGRITLFTVVKRGENALTVGARSHFFTPKCP